MKETMLIIDDDTAVLTSCQRIFKQEGFEVTTTTNPLEGLGLAPTKNIRSFFVIGRCRRLTD